MGQIDFYLFRIKLVKPKQKNLFESNLTNSDILKKAISEKPSAELRKDYIWHIGNTEAINEFSGYFAFGRTTKSIVEKFDEDTGNFVEDTYETSPYTHILYHANIGFLAIAKKSRLAPTVKGIAKNIAKILESSDTIKNLKIEILIDPIPDPKKFIEIIKDSYAVKNFSVTFHKPNPFDAEEFFHKPMSVYLNAVDGEKGKTTVEGKDLERDTLVIMSRSIAATGNDAQAKIVDKYGDQPRIRKLQGDDSCFSVDEDTPHDEILSIALKKYNSVRS